MLHELNMTIFVECQTLVLQVTLNIRVRQMATVRSQSGGERLVRRVASRNVYEWEC